MTSSNTKNRFSFNNLRFSTKLPMLVVSAALLSGGIVGYNAINTMDKTAFAAAETQFKTSAQSRAELLRNYLESVVGNVHALSDNPTIFSAIPEFSQAYEALGGNQTEVLQQAYITKNPNPQEKRNELVDAQDGSVYSQVHAKYHPWLNEFMTEMGLYDIFLISPSGNVVYSTAKERDFATNLNSGAAKETALANLFRRATDLPSGSEDVVYEDYKPYAPSNGVPAAFIGRPVFDNAGSRIGIVAFQMPVEKINAIMESTNGLGQTGELSLYGSDLLMRNDSRFEKESTILKRSSDTEQVKLGLEGKSGVIADAVNFKGQNVLAVYEPFTFQGANYTMVGEIDKSEIQAPLVAQRNQIIMHILGIIFVITALGILVVRGISKRVSTLGSVMGELAQGKFPAIPYQSDKDEMGDMSNALEGLKGKMVENYDFIGQIDAIGKSQAVIEFNMDGTIINANKNFLSTVGYSMDEIKGKHHGMFVDPAYRSGVEYAEFWASLNRGQYQAAEYKRIGKGGKEVWIQASYNPIMDLDGKPFKVVKYATETTKQKLQNADFSGQIDAIGKSQAVIEFNMDGTVVHANQNFLSTIGYVLDEIKGKHHSMFVDPAYKNSAEYKQFWEALGRGEYQAAEYKRIGKGGKEIWIQASYNPIMDLNGKPFKVVKYATDITQMVHTRQENERGMNEAVSVLQQVSAGNLSNKMDGEYAGTFADIKRALNATVDKLIDIVGNIKQSSQSVSTASGEISAGSNDLSERTEQQASSLEETAASMEEITSTVRQNSENAKNANQLSSEARDVAERGGKVVEEAVGAMNRIEQSSQKIADIISVIDEIAFQTNLLALNAAVEAARAGEAGKGFAVVASEVRSLAGRSASASKEIKSLIMESSGQVKSGAELVNKAGETLREIVGSVKKVADIVSDIATASAEQATGIDEINSAISQMDEMTQQNAALVEENTAAAQSLVSQAGMLDEMMRFFRVAESDVREVVAEHRLHASANTAGLPTASAPRARVTGKAAQGKPANAKAGKSGLKIVAHAQTGTNGSGKDANWEEF